MTQTVQWFDLPGEPTGAEGDLTALTYHLLRGLTPSRTEAEHLTVEVFRRSQEPLSKWLLGLPTETRLKAIIIQTFMSSRLSPTRRNVA